MEEPVTLVEAEDPFALKPLTRTLHFTEESHARKDPKFGAYEVTKPMVSEAVQKAGSRRAVRQALRMLRKVRVAELKAERRRNAQTKQEGGRSEGPTR